MVSTNFRYWLEAVEWVNTFRSLIEAALDPLHVSINQTNPVIAKSLATAAGIDPGQLAGTNWMGIVAQQSGAVGAKGQDVMDVANQVAAEIINALHSGTDNFVNIAKQLAAEPERLVRAFTQTAKLRARRIFLDQFKRGRKNQTTSFSTMDKPDYSAISQLPDQSAAADESDVISSYKTKILATLDQMAAESNHKRTQERIKIAKAAALIRIEAMPEPVPYHDLLARLREKGYELSDSQMDVVLKDVQDAFRRVLEDIGDEKNIAAIDNMKTRKRRAG